MTRRIKAVLCSPMWILALPVFLMVGLYLAMVGIGACGWDGWPVPAPRVEAGGTLE